MYDKVLTGEASMLLLVCIIYIFYIF